MSRLSRCVATLLVAAMACAGCGYGRTDAEESTRVSTYTDAPTPAGAATVPRASAQPFPAQADCGDPTASLRPRGDVTRGPKVDAIRARGHLLVGLDTGSNLFSFRDPITGTIGGFDVEIAKEVARDLFGDPERIEYRMRGSSDRVAALQNHQVDIIAKTMSITCERRRQVAFSTEYFEANQRVLAPKPSKKDTLGRDVPTIDSIMDLGGRKVCVAKGTTSLQHIQRYQPAATIVAVPTWADCLVSLQQRQVDAVSTDDAILAGLAQQDPYLQIVGPSLGIEPYGIGIAKDADDLVRFVNRTLERIRRDGTWDRIYRRWLSILGPSPGAPEPHYQD